MSDLINREDALTALNGACSTWEDDAKVQEIVMAIPSAKQTGDLISRADAIEAVDGLKERPQKYYTQYNNALSDAVLELTTLPSADAVSREEVTEIKNNYINEISELLNKIDALSAEAVQGWIPCSERLPSAEDCPMDCMVTRYSEQIGAYVDMAVCERDGTWTHEDWDAIVLGDVESGRKTGLMNTHDHPILAWMPLPTPYKGGDDATDFYVDGAKYSTVCSYGERKE